MPTKPVKIDILVAKLNTETFKTLPRLRLDSSNLLYLKVYKETIERIRLNGIEVAKMEELIKPSSKKPKSQKTATIMVRSLWKLSISPINLEIRQQGFSKEVPSRSLVVVITGQAIGKVSMVPGYLNNILPEFLGVNNMATTGDIGVFLSNKDKYVQYLDVFLNTSLGQTILELSKYGTTNQHIDLQIFMRQYVPLILVNKVTRLIESAIEEYEAKAWRAYFKAMKIVEEYLGADVEQLSGTSSYKEVSAYGRLDSKFYVYLNALRRLSEAQILRANELFDVKLGTAPRSREYKSLERGEPYVSYDAIDDSGFIDEELFYRLPNPPRTTARARKFSILITSVAHSIEGIGKVGILYPYDNMLCMTGLAILNPSSTKLRSVAQKIGYLKEKTVEEFMLYAFAVLKSRLMRKVMQSLTYGLTAQISKKDIENLPIPLIKDLLNSDVISSVKEFVENLYQANVLKRQAIMELENYILRLLN